MRHFENLFLRAGHIFCRACRLVVPAGEMQKAMDDTQSGLFARTVAKAGCILPHDTSSDQDFAVREGDDIGRRRVIEVISVNFCDRGIAEDGRFDFTEPA